MDKYTELKNQVEEELKWCIESIEENHSGYGIPENLTLSDFVGNNFYSNLTLYERGMLFAYLSIKSKIDSLEKGDLTYYEEKMLDARLANKEEES